MMMTVSILSSTVAAGAVAVAGFIGYHLGHAAGRDQAENEIENAAAAECPTCVRLVEPAERLDAIGATVSGVEYFGHRDPTADPVHDANWIVRIAMTHAHRVRLHRNVQAVVTHRDAKHHDANGDRITG